MRVRRRNAFYKLDNSITVAEFDARRLVDTKIFSHIDSLYNLLICITTSTYLEQLLYTTNTRGILS